MTSNRCWTFILFNLIFEILCYHEIEQLDRIMFMDNSQAYSVVQPFGASVYKYFFQKTFWTADLYNL